MSNPFVNKSYNENSSEDVPQQPQRRSPSLSEENGSSNRSQSSSKHSSWVKFDDKIGTDDDNASEVAVPLETLQSNNTTDSVTNSNGTSRISSISTGTTSDSPDKDFATIELSNSIEITHPSKAIQQQPVNNNNNNVIQNLNSKVSQSVVPTSSLPPTPTTRSTLSSASQLSSSNNSATAVTSSGPMQLTTATNNSDASGTSNGTNQHFANGDIIVNLLPLNDGCDWITPAKFKPHLVPEELMAQSLTLTVEDYVNTMSMLLNDYRFNFYIIFYKRVLGLWITIGVMVLLSILFSGWKGITLFTAGMLWLILNALGIFLAIYTKQKLYRMLEQAIAQANAVFGRHNIYLGVDDRGRYSCHKVNLVFIYFDANYCVKFLQDMLNNSEHQVITNRLNNNQLDNQFVITLNNTLQSIDTSDIVITGSAPKNISQKEKYAEKLLLRYSQRWIREYNRERMELNATPPTTTTTATTGTNGTTMMNNQQPHPPARKSSAAVTAIPMTSRHCRTSKCFCQFIEEHLKYKPLTSTCSFTELLY